MRRGNFQYPFLIQVIDVHCIWDIFGYFNIKPLTFENVTLCNIVAKKNLKHGNINHQ